MPWTPPWSCSALWSVATTFPGRWALMRTVADGGGEQAREKCRALEFDTVMSRADAAGS